jgi:hypothetical protein
VILYEKNVPVVPFAIVELVITGGEGGEADATDPARRPNALAGLGNCAMSATADVVCSNRRRVILLMVGLSTHECYEW